MTTKFKIKVSVLKKMFALLDKQLNAKSFKKETIEGLIIEKGRNIEVEESSQIDRYINDIKLKMKGMHEDEQISFLLNRANIICSLIGYNSYSDFLSQEVSPITLQQRNLLGQYYSLVRQNSIHQNILLCSAVEIKVENGILVLYAYTPNRCFYGEVKLISENMFCQLVSNDGVKTFQWIYKVGTSPKPKLLKGVYAGISSGNEPICGRVILKRWDEKMPFPFDKNRFLKSYYGTSPHSVSTLSRSV